MFASDLMTYESKGTGVIIIWKKRLLFTVGNKKYWNKAVSPIIVTYTSTGGHVEPDEAVLNASKREVLEELGCEVELLSSPDSLICELETLKVDRCVIDDEIAPILVYNSSDIEMSVCVYLGRISTNPNPKAEVPALLLLPVNLLTGGVLCELLINGAILIEQEEGIIPRNAYLKPFGSATVLIEHWEIFNKNRQFSQYLSLTE